MLLTSCRSSPRATPVLLSPVLGALRHALQLSAGHADTAKSGELLHQIFGGSLEAPVPVYSVAFCGLLAALCYGLRPAQLDKANSGLLAAVLFSFAVCPPIPHSATHPSRKTFVSKEVAVIKERVNRCCSLMTFTKSAGMLCRGFFGQCPVRSNLKIYYRQIGRLCQGRCQSCPWHLYIRMWCLLSAVASRSALPESIPASL